jgi:gamma-glutamyltranspeptidase / glutathione hydrolase
MARFECATVNRKPVMRGLLKRTQNMPKQVSVLSPSLSRHRKTTKSSVRSVGGIVVSQCRVASEAGARVLKEGGHAVDAAVAAAFVVGIAEPWMSGIGGIGAMLVRDAKTGIVTGFDFGGVSPVGLDPADYAVAGGVDANLFGWPQVKDNRNTVGAYAVVAPTQPAGLEAAHKKFGTKRWADLLQPAIELATLGPIVDWHTTLMVASAMGDLAKDAHAAARFLPNGLPPQPPIAAVANGGVRLPMPALARSIRAIASEGASALSTGALAQTVAADIRAMGGSLSTADLAATVAREVQPLEVAYGARTIHVMPELNGGPTLAVAYRELMRRRPTPSHALDGATFVAYGQALQHAWIDRFKRLGDAGERSAPTCTTHISVVDRAGNMVTLTQTLLSLFGARIVLPQSGILMNNGINWFDPVAGGPNSIAPGRRALANYAPAIMTGAETGPDAAIALGGSGGRKIIPAVFQALAMAADFGFDLDTIVHQPRIDVSGGSTVAIDRRLDAETQSVLAGTFDTVLAEPVVYPFPFTVLSGVRRVGGLNEGATEPEHPWSEAVSEDQV